MADSLQQQIQSMLCDLIRQLSSPPDRPRNLPALRARSEELCVHIAGIDGDGSLAEALALVREATTILSQTALRSSVMSSIGTT